MNKVPATTVHRVHSTIDKNGSTEFFTHLIFPFHRRFCIYFAVTFTRNDSAFYSFENRMKLFLFYFRQLRMRLRNPFNVIYALQALKMRSTLATVNYNLSINFPFYLVYGWCGMATLQKYFYALLFSAYFFLFFFFHVLDLLKSIK